ncbi:MAG: hypothetical protein ACT4P4_25845 [Betaproteobacteria bacterium]
MRVLALALCAAFAAPAIGEGPGTRIRSGGTVELPSLAPRVAEERCDKVRGAERERCLREMKAREEAADQKAKASGPGTTGMSSGAASGATSGTSGGATFGSASPR